MQRITLLAKKDIKTVDVERLNQNSAHLQVEIDWLRRQRGSEFPAERIYDLTLPMY